MEVFVQRLLVLSTMEFYRVTSVVTWDFGFCGLIQRTSPVIRVVGHARGASTLWLFLTRRHTEILAWKRFQIPLYQSTLTFFDYVFYEICHQDFYNLNSLTF